MTGANSIWYIHPYAGGPGVGRYDRPFHLSRYWQEAGFAPVVITASNHHLLNQAFPVGRHQIENVPYHFLETPVYRGNGLDRVFNMAVFSARLLTEGTELVRMYGRPRLMIASSPHPYVFPSAHRLARRFKAHSVFEVRDLWPLSLVELAGVKPGHPLVRLTGAIERFAYRHADTTVSLLPLAKEYMVSQGLRPQCFRHIPNGIEAKPAVDRVAVTEAVQQARAWREKGSFVIIYAGALGPPNNVGSLIRAVLDIRDAGQGDVRAIVVGRGDQAEALSEIISAREGNDVVRIFDQVPKQVIQHLFEHADAGYISLRPEPLFRFGISPNKLFDYMLARLPVISAIDAGNDPVRDAGCGLTVKPDQSSEIVRAIISLLNLPLVERQKMGERGHRYVVANHSYANLASQYSSLLGAQRG